MTAIIIAKVKTFTEKVQDKIKDQIDSLDHYLADKSILSKENISDGVLDGQKKCTFKEFSSMIRNIKKNGIMTTCVGTLRFTPAHSSLDFKLNHIMKVYMLYSKKRHVTYVYIRDDGYIDWSKIRSENDMIGTVLKFNGLVTHKDLMGDRYDKLMTNIFTELYNSKEERLEAASKNTHDNINEYDKEESYA